MRFRYSRWDDTQDPFGPDLAAADLLEELSDDVLGGAGIEGALQRLIREGCPTASAGSTRCGTGSADGARRSSPRSTSRARSRTCASASTTSSTASARR